MAKPVELLADAINTIGNTILDVFSEIMRHVRLTACVYFQRDFCAPWSMRMADTGFAQFHVITSGACVLEAGGQYHDVGTGDILFFPRGLSHTLSDRPGRDAVNGAEFMASLATERPMFSEGTSPTRMICGHYAYQWDVAHPLLNELPELVHIRANQPAGSPAIPALIQLILTELSRCDPGYALIVEHHAEVLLIHTLRCHFQALPRRTGFFAALNDAALGRAISRIHTDFANPLSLGDLAQSAGMSRSVFSQRFSDTVKMSPIVYLANWRMLVAQDLLRTTDHPVVEIADRVGYGSDIAFARAYKRSFGLTPSASRVAQAH